MISNEEIITALEAYGVQVGQTKKLASFESHGGKNYALQLERSKAFYLWIEDRGDKIASIQGVVAARLYPEDKSRASNLRGTLRPGNSVWLIKLHSLDGLKNVMDMYTENEPTLAPAVGSVPPATDSHGFTLAEYLSKAFDASSRTQADIAALLGYSRPNIITMWKVGKTPVPFEKIRPIATVLNLDMADLLSRFMREYHSDMYRELQQTLGCK